MSEWHLLNWRVRLEALITEREAMLAANVARLAHGYAQAYGEEAFIEVQKAIVSLDEQMRKIGA